MLVLRCGVHAGGCGCGCGWRWHDCWRVRERMGRLGWSCCCCYMEVERETREVETSVLSVGFCLTSLLGSLGFGYRGDQVL